jgi:hypothetical protein
MRNDSPSVVGRVIETLLRADLVTVREVLSPTGFVLDLATEFGHADAGDVPGQALVAEHPGDVEVFDHYRAVLADEPGGQLVQAVAAGVGDSGVECRDSGLGRAPPLRGLLPGTAVRAGTARRLPLQPPQLPLRYLQVAGVGDDGSGMNGRRPRLARLLRGPEVTAIVVEHRDRLGRFGVELDDLATDGWRGESRSVTGRSPQKRPETPQPHCARRPRTCRRDREKGHPQPHPSG